MMSRTLLIGQASQPTGMARVVRALARHLAGHREVHVLGIDHHAPEPQIQPGGWTLHPNKAPWDIFAEGEIGRLAERLEPQAILHYHDPWFIPRMVAAHGRGTSLVAAYCPIDGPFIAEEPARALAVVDRLVVPSAFARDALLGAVGDSLRHQAPFNDIAVIAHGVELADFYPMVSAHRECREAARCALFPGQPELWEGFWVLNANRNHGRKRLDLTIQGFAGFALDKPKSVRLYLHWGAERTGTRVMALARSLGVGDRIVLPQRAAGTTPRLNLVYNACDVGVNTSSGEGWGLVSFEHAATGAPQIVGDHSACAELWRGAAALLPVERTLFRAGVVGGSQVDPAALSKTLERLYADPAHYAERAHAAQCRAEDPCLRWSSLAEGWHQLLTPTRHTEPLACQTY